jgi:hypothetical protein
VLAAYRRTGADPPFANLTAAHGVGLEGYYWRFTDVAAGRVVIVLCGACLGPDGPWAVVAVGAHPGGFLRWTEVQHVTTDPRRLGVRAGDVLTGDARALRVRLDGAEVDAVIEPERPWPRRAFGGLGPAQIVPGLGQYWHPHLLLGTVRGAARLGGESVPLGGATVYGEKNWGTTFAPDWWWGQAHGLGDGAACIAFAGGRLAVGAPTAVAVALDGGVLRLGPPFAQMVTAVGDGGWRVRGRGPVHAVELEAEADPGAAHILPVPVVGEHRSELRSAQHLAGRLALTVRRGRRVVFRGESHLAGLERGTP